MATEKREQYATIRKIVKQHCKYSRSYNDKRQNHNRMKFVGDTVSKAAVSRIQQEIAAAGIENVTVANEMLVVDFWKPRKRPTLIVRVHH